MEFKFAVNDVLRQPIVEIGSNLLPPGFTGDRRAFWDVVGKVSEVVNVMGEASAAAQGLTKPITTAERLRNSEHKIYLLIDQNAANGRGAVTGMLKTGKKGLYVFDRNGQHFQVSPPCVLDFYIHESRQRTGLGKRLFEHMLQTEGIGPVQMAIDRPSEKFLGFLNKHYSLSNPVKQMNNYVVFDGFFPSTLERNNSPVEVSNHSGGQPGKKQSANGLQTSSFASPLGRYGAPRPPCSMGQIIHNQTSTIPKSTEPTGVRSSPETNYQYAAEQNIPRNTNVTQSTPNVYYRSQTPKIKLDGMSQEPMYPTANQNAEQDILYNQQPSENIGQESNYNYVNQQQMQTAAEQQQQNLQMQNPNTVQQYSAVPPQKQTAAEQQQQQNLQMQNPNTMQQYSAVPPQNYSQFNQNISQSHNQPQATDQSQNMWQPTLQTSVQMPQVQDQTQNMWQQLPQMPQAPTSNVWQQPTQTQNMPQVQTDQTQNMWQQSVQNIPQGQNVWQQSPQTYYVQNSNQPQQPTSYPVNLQKSLVQSSNKPIPTTYPVEMQSTTNIPQQNPVQNSNQSQPTTYPVDVQSSAQIPQQSPSQTYIHSLQQPPQTSQQNISLSPIAENYAGYQQNVEHQAQNVLPGAAPYAQYTTASEKAPYIPGTQPSVPTVNVIAPQYNTSVPNMVPSQYNVTTTQAVQQPTSTVLNEVPAQPNLAAEQQQQYQNVVQNIQSEPSMNMGQQSRSQINPAYNNQTSKYTLPHELPQMQNQIMNSQNYHTEGDQVNKTNERDERLPTYHIQGDLGTAEKIVSLAYGYPPQIPDPLKQAVATNMI